MTASEAFDLARFHIAQDRVFSEALAELREGRKRGHWIWFVFPQLQGLGRSPTAAYYAIRSADEARAFLADPVLGGRLDLAVRALLANDTPPLEERLGALDALKFRSSMTLFEAVADPPALFAEALDRLCGGQRDPVTLARLGDSVPATRQEGGDEG